MGDPLIWDVAPRPMTVGSTMVSTPTGLERWSLSTGVRLGRPSPHLGKLAMISGGEDEHVFMHCTAQVDVVATLPRRSAPLS